MKRLIVNADDFGMTPGINRAVIELAAAGVLTSATLMASAPETVAAAAAASESLAPKVGCHVVLVDGSPVAPANEIPTLIDPRSTAGEPRFRPTLGRFLADLFRGRIRESDIEAEAVAQIRRLQKLEIRVSHLDTHKHTHAFPRVLRPLLRAAVLCNVPCIRNPFEPEWCRAVTGKTGWVRGLQVRALATQQRYFLQATEHIGLLTTDGALGVLATGTLDSATIRRVLQTMPDGIWELVCHPGYHDSALDATRTRLLHSREVERRALLEVLPEAASSGISLLHYGQLKAASFLGVM